MRMVAAHTGFPNGAVDYAGCSWPVPYDGALVNGMWQIPSVSRTYGTRYEAIIGFVVLLSSQ